MEKHLQLQDAGAELQEALAWYRERSPRAAENLWLRVQDARRSILLFPEAIRSQESERQMEDLLRSIDKRIRTIRLDYANQNPFIAVDVGLSERIPLTQAGQGICRLVSIFSELLGQKPQVLSSGFAASFSSRSTRLAGT